ncbi:hypothetical protein RHS01_05185 [Rhizoctonia solani]|uniref:Uncharacterized protein n=1 Tax=Rhizoctonia solani TaxID=456999 RepID=A0A8H7M5D9_9AGAM|nr:hypothetical protein RHS01_05185 [Rhizoctonia solani]
MQVKALRSRRFLWPRAASPVERELLPRRASSRPQSRLDRIYLPSLLSHKPPPPPHSVAERAAPSVKPRRSLTQPRFLRSLRSLFHPSRPFSPSLPQLTRWRLVLVEPPSSSSKLASSQANILASSQTDFLGRAPPTSPFIRGPCSSSDHPHHPSSLRLSRRSLFLLGPLNPASLTRPLTRLRLALHRAIPLPSELSSPQAHFLSKGNYSSYLPG